MTLVLVAASKKRNVKIDLFETPANIIDPLDVANSASF